MHAACQSRGMHGILKALAYLRIVAVLTGILDYVNKCLVLQLVSNLTATILICQEILFWQTNQLAFPCHFCGRNFMAQSCVMRTEEVSRFSRRLVLALSC